MTLNKLCKTLLYRNSICIYVCIYTYIYAYICIYICIYTYNNRDKPRTWVQILASVIFFNCSVAFFLCYPGEALECPISTGVCKNSRVLIQITAYKYVKLLCYVCIYIYIYTYAYIYAYMTQ